MHIVAAATSRGEAAIAAAVVLLDLVRLLAAVMSSLARPALRLYLTGLGLGTLVGQGTEPAQELAIDLEE